MSGDSFSIYIDEDAMGTSLVITLRSRHVKVTTAREAGTIRKSDEEHLAFATKQPSVLYSFNIRDFYRIHTQWLRTERQHAGIILAQQRQHSIGEQAQRILLISDARTASAMRDKVEFLSNWD